MLGWESKEVEVLTRIAMSALTLCALASAVEAQQCNLNRKTIRFNITVCSGQGCTPGAERVDIIGAHIVHYSSAAAGVGTVYTVGQTIDLCNDQANAALWQPRCSKVDDIVKANAIATYANNEIRLTIEQLFFKRALNNQLYAKVVDVMRIGITNCSACQLLDSTTTGYNATGTHPLLTMGGSGGCEISELSP